MVLLQVLALSMAELPIYPDTIMDTVDASLSADNGVSLSSAEMLERQHVITITSRARTRVAELLG
jgi:trehalose utilization protein|eukprot:COSAG02_NODE_407_length_22898_cov_135.264047_9_plen_65_part_00